MQAHLVPGMMMGEYEIIARLGGGGMSDVYHARQSKRLREATVERNVALKVLLPELASDVECVDRFVREARMVARLQHSNIVPVFDYGTVDDYAFLVMPLLRGGTLIERILRQGAFAADLSGLDKIASFLGAVSEALDYAHSEGIVHCDIKPGNILFDDHGVGMLADFGIALTLGSKTQEHERSQSLIGSFSYMPPELWRGERITPWTDQYAMGLVIYALVTGHPPFGSDLSSMTELMRKHLSGMPVPVHYLRGDSTEAVNQTIMRAISKKPSDRWPTMCAFAEAFRDAVMDVHSSTESGSLMSNDPGRKSTPYWAIQPTRIAHHQASRVSRTSLAEYNSPQARIFISYRRGDTSVMTDRIYDELVAVFGEEMVFRDLDSIPLGTNFKRYIENVVHGCVVELVVIGKEWAGVGEHGSRLDNPDDFVRVEIESALDLDKPIIPILVDGALMPLRETLPVTMRELVYCNGTKVRADPDFKTDVERLVRAVERLLRIG